MIRIILYDTYSGTLAYADYMMKYDGGVLGLTVDGVGDEAHRDAGDGRQDGAPGLQQRHGRRADRAHQVEPLEPRASDTWRIA